MNTQNTNQEVITQEQPVPQTTTSDFRKILVAVDYLAATPKVFEQAIDIASKYNSQLMIFHCVQGEMPGVSEVATATSIGTYGWVYSQNMLELSQELVKEATEELQAWLKGFSKRATEKGITTDFDYQVGEPGVQICAKAKEWGSDLIVVGRRGRTGISEMLLGSVSNYIVHHAHCSVLVVQH